MQALIDNVSQIVTKYSDEHEITSRVAKVLTDALASGLEIPDYAKQPNPERYVMYPLYVADDKRFSIASAVWDVCQGTPVHGHETWGVVGIYSGHEYEISYEKPKVTGAPLNPNGKNVWRPGEVTVCCTTDDDVHQVSCEGSEPVIGIHIYGADIGTLKRRSYDPASGEVEWFVSTWGETA